MVTVSGVVPPPPGVTPNFSPGLNAEQWKAINVPAVMLGLCTIIFFLRIYTRGWIVRAFGMDDYVIGVAWVRKYLTQSQSNTV
ncbi:hypothetical protein K432DRAFT_411864 [Lepidopterella palustris CBS 459.81]|uniref:Uncharacterized protein n=1 Tax=Lepidopterella palustris CBS 459.81 TaxID=1314670 RepID=A0A8E2J7L3_9PEZI|nr:hypothetical protein K432DRAFT_411864 [Lepidopterella palustris CBS 459.81]